MTDRQTKIMEKALEVRLRIAQENVTEAEEWLNESPSSDPDYEETLEELSCWQGQVAEIEERIAARKKTGS